MYYLDYPEEPRPEFGVWFGEKGTHLFRVIAGDEQLSTSEQLVVALKLKSLGLLSDDGTPIDPKARGGFQEVNEAQAQPGR